MSFLTHSKTEQYNHENLLFVDVLSACCRLVTERREDVADLALNKWLYLILNLSPVLEQQESIYAGIIKGGNTAARIEKLKVQLSKDISSVLMRLRYAPIIYDQPEEDLAKLHFNGAFGRGIPDWTTYDYEPSWAVRSFKQEVYQKIRSAFTVEELELIEQRDTKLAVVYLLTGYYINEYYKAVASVLRKAGLNYLLNFNGTQQDKLEEILRQLTRSRYKEYLQDGDVNPPSPNEKTQILSKKVCTLSCRSKLIKFLDSLTEEFKIGTRACSKRDFANIVYVLMDNLSCWKEKRFATSKRILSMYYGVQEPQYKVSDCDEFLRTDEGKKLQSMIDKFNDSIQ